MIYQLVENIDILLKLKIIIAIWKINIDISKCLRYFFSGKKLMILLKKGNNNVAISTSIISQYNWHFYMRDRYLSLNAPFNFDGRIFLPSWIYRRENNSPRLYMPSSSSIISDSFLVWFYFAVSIRHFDSARARWILGRNIYSSFFTTILKIPSVLKLQPKRAYELITRWSIAALLSHKWNATKTKFNEMMLYGSIDCFNIDYTALF